MTGSSRLGRRGEIAALVVVALFPTLASWLYFVVWADAPWMRTLYLGAKLLQALLPLGAWALGMRGAAPAAGESAVVAAGASARHRRARGLLAGVASGVVLGAAVLLATAAMRTWAPFAVAPQRIEARLHALGVHGPVAFVVLALALSVAHSLFEEYYWRWFLFGQLATRLPRRAAIVLASLAFASHHWIVVDSFLGGRHRLDATLPLTLAVAAAGALWCALYYRWRSLLPPWASHLLVDAALMVVGWQLVAARLGS